MKSMIIATISFLAAFAAAQPSPPTVTLQLANDISGRNANKVITAAGNRYALSSLFAGTAVDNNGQIEASSAQLVAFPNHVQCAIFKDRLISVLTQDHTYADLDGDSSKLTVVNLNGAYIECNAPA